MTWLLLFGIFLLNAVISCFNAWSVGKTWDYTRTGSATLHLVNWCGYIMAVCGFTWCYLVILGLLGATIPISEVAVSPEMADGATKMVPFFTESEVLLFFDLGYLMIIVPILGSGFVITVHSWVAFYRKRSIANGAVGAYNTFAMIHNSYQAFSAVPDAFGRVRNVLGGDKKDVRGLLIIALVAICLLGGWMTARFIANSAREATAHRLKYEMDLYREAA